MENPHVIHSECHASKVNVMHAMYTYATKKLLDGFVHDPSLIEMQQVGGGVV